MTPRDFEHEGPLTNPEAQKIAKKVRAEADRIWSELFKRLSVDDDFMLWFQKYAYPVMAQAVPFHGADLERFMGRRELIAGVIKEMDDAVPGFLGRLIGTRDDYEQRLKAAEEK